MRIWLGLVLAAAGAMALGCAGGAPKASAPTPAAMAPPMELGDRHAEIEALDREIGDAMARGQVTPEVTSSCRGETCATAMSQPFAVPAATDATCHPAASDRCTDACTISTSICTNQQRICELAAQLAGDDWAANKCTSARASCQAARASCCSCAL